MTMIRVFSSFTWAYRRHKSTSRDDPGFTRCTDEVFCDITTSPHFRAASAKRSKVSGIWRWNWWSRFTKFSVNDQLVTSRTQTGVFFQWFCLSSWGEAKNWNAEEEVERTRREKKGGLFRLDGLGSWLYSFFSKSLSLFFQESVL